MDSESTVSAVELCEDRRVVRFANYSVWVFVKATAGLLYIVSSFDLIPDLFPGVDWADDILVVGYVCNLLVNELEAFAVWRNRLQIASER